METLYNATTAVAETAKQAIWGKPEDQSGKEPVAGGEPKSSSKSQPYDPGNALDSPVAASPGPGRTEFPQIDAAKDVAPPGNAVVNESDAAADATKQSSETENPAGALAGTGSETKGEAEAAGKTEANGADAAAANPSATDAPAGGVSSSTDASGTKTTEQQKAEEKVAQLTSIPDEAKETAAEIKKGDSKGSSGTSTDNKSPLRPSPGGVAAAKTRSRDESPAGSPSRKGLREKLKEKLHISKKDKS